ncbi:hypothetical protein Mal15_45250 [Stieleria maiorica]|uniref:Uncharacterized protein n=1 Tax=Stieleria maiorica TaxID=2795974 RepID=A0A5B9MLD5_9BACT|nr:hypothetical protein Mal15_45250 [Stieleria maiorica]
MQAMCDRIVASCTKKAEKRQVDKNTALAELKPLRRSDLGEMPAPFVLPPFQTIESVNSYNVRSSLKALYQSVNIFIGHSRFSTCHSPKFAAR